MSDILIRPPQLRSTAQTLRQKARTLRAALESVDKILAELNTARFEGTRAATLRSRYSRTRPKIFAAPTLIETFAQELETAAQVFEKADQGSSSPDPIGRIPFPTPVPFPHRPVEPIILPLPIIDPGFNIDPPHTLPQPIDLPKQETPIQNIGLKQTDYNDVMGGNGMTIKQVGCLITDVAMIARFLGKDVTPVDVNQFLQANGGYAPGSSSLYWNKAADFINSNTGSHGSFVDIGAGNAASAIQSGQPVILHIPSTTSDGHWVLAVPGGDGSGFTAFDPLTGGQRTISPETVLGAKAFTAGTIQM